MSDTVPAAGRRLWRDEFLLQRLVERNEAAAVQRIAAAQEKDAEVFMGERAGDGNVFCIHPSILHTPSDIRGHTVYFPKNIYHRSELSSSADGGADERKWNVHEIADHGGRVTPSRLISLNWAAAYYGGLSVHSPASVSPRKKPLISPWACSTAPWSLRVLRRVES